MAAAYLGTSIFGIALQLSIPLSATWRGMNENSTDRENVHLTPISFAQCSSLDVVTSSDLSRSERNCRVVMVNVTIVLHKVKDMVRRLLVSPDHRTALLADPER